MPCQASLDLLPQELLDEIVQHLSLTSLARLASCNKTLCRRFEPLLYSRDDACNQAMIWACTRGYVSAIRRLVSNYRVPVSTVDIHFPSRTWSRRENKWTCIDRSAKVLTLTLAASRAQVNAFRVLLDLGARIDIPGLRRESVPRLINGITQPVDGDWKMLRLFYNAQLHTQVIQEGRGEPALPLLRLVGRASPTPPVDPVRLLLSLGADPNILQQPYDLSRRMIYTPLTAAMSQHGYDPTEVLEILLKHGADIHGPELDRPVDRARHIPIFVAAESMATYGTKLVQWCLIHGADINQSVIVFDQLHYNGWSSWSTGRLYYTATPALAYMQSLHRTAFETDSKYGPVYPLQGLIYLFTHGAIIDPPPDRTQRQQLYPNPNKSVAPPWCIELLVWRWGLGKAEKSSSFRAMLRHLIQHSVCRGHAGEVLARCETAYTRWVGAHSVRSNGLLRKWKKWPSEGRDPTEVQCIMRVHVLDYLTKEIKIAPTTLLQQYIIARGELMDREEQTTYTVMEYLLAEGAEINAPIADDGCTALHRLCQTYHGFIKAGISQTVDGSDARSEFLRVLVRMGADGSIVVGGQTAWDVLLVHTMWYSDLLLVWARIVGWKEKQTIA
ncbi:hypothetical protein BO78DRAFT_393507 [Aspergillus sclerotiicarbonarius CBS 121057]|uniref:F-box domain-containing protein n=1 Tax=Aspergillus sclerotiicarbonarius (strain CBS 121057 / IBT 28362) TaxID=1448318 RepID=A0A319EU11_ASPSB|nr:hypothetical protein BO78DRAFT_393507 [Aspergillus sclerotiicarbonarius CBS 121057]